MPQITRINPTYTTRPAVLRVAPYCRVSTDSRDQLNSYANQIRVYTKLVNDRPDWKLTEVFADEGISGTSADKRPEFLRLMKCCEAKQIDLVITKSISRFARNVKEALEYTRRLKKIGVGVMFEKEGINTLSVGDEMLINVFAAIAQEESVSISQNVRLSVIKRMEDGEFTDSNAPYGYKLVDKQLSIFDSEANVVRLIYNWYLNGMSITVIAKKLNSDGIPTKSGHGSWCAKTIAYIISNERYAGDSLYMKKFRSSTVPFRQYKNHGEHDRYYADDTHSAIIDRETFDAVQRLLKSRQEYYSHPTVNTYPLTSRIRCSECGSLFHRRIVSGGIKWACAKHICSSSECASNYYNEERIYSGFCAIINKLRFDPDDLLGKTEQQLESAVLLMKKQNNDAYRLSQSISELNAKLLMLEQLHTKGFITPDVYQSQAQGINAQISKLKNERLEKFDSVITTTLNEVRKLRKRILEINEPLEVFDEKLFCEIAEDITINRDDEMTLTLTGGLRFIEII